MSKVVDILCGSTLSLGLHETRPRFEISSLKTEKSIWNIETLTKRTNFNSVKLSIKCTKLPALEIVNLSLSLECALLWNKTNSLISKTSSIVLFPYGNLLLFNTKLSQWHGLKTPLTFYHHKSKWWIWIFVRRRNI